MTEVTVSCPVKPSESRDKVVTAVTNIFPGIELEEDVNGMLSGRSDLTYFSKLIRKQEILDSTRAMLFKGRHGNRTTLRLNKQVAYVGKVSFTEERCVLGYLKVDIVDDELEALIDRVAPVTVDGKEVIQ